MLNSDTAPALLNRGCLMEKLPWWNDAQRALADEAERFADELTLHAQELVWRRKYPVELIKEAGKRGWLGTIIPEEYGGSPETGFTGSCIVLEELSRVSLAGMHCVVHLCDEYMLLKHGSDALKEELLPKMARGDLIGALVVTEPYVGNDAAAIETVARKEGDEYILEGKKRFISGVGVSDVYFVLARTSDEPEAVRRHNHLSIFVVEREAENFHVERVNELMGFDNIYNAYLDLDGVRVPADRMLGGEGEGWRALMTMANYERLLASAVPLGCMREALRYAVFHMSRRIQFGQPTLALPTNQFKVADMFMRYHAARLMTYHAAYLFDLGKEPIIEVAAARCFNADLAFKVFEDATQCMGGDGVTRFYPVEAFVRNGKIGQLAPTTTDIMKLVIFRFGLRAWAEALRPPRRKVHEELKVPVTVGYYGTVSSEAAEERSVAEDDVLRTLAENYKVNPGLYMHRNDLKEELGIGDEKLDELLTTLESKRLATLYRRKGKIELARATFKGLKAAKVEEYRWFPEWVDMNDMF